MEYTYMPDPSIDQTNIAVINTNIGYIQQDIKDIKQGIKELSGVYATKLTVDALTKTIETRIKKLEDSSNLWRWLSPIMSLVLGSLMTFLIIQYLGHVH